MKIVRQTVLNFFVLAAVVALTGCATGQKQLTPVNDGPQPSKDEVVKAREVLSRAGVQTSLPSNSELLKGLDVVQQPELEPEWADFVKQHYPSWRQHYWVDRGNWGNRGYITGGPSSAPATPETQITPLPIATSSNMPAIISTPVIVENAPSKVDDATPRTYTVKKGDSLWRIAGKLYGNPFKWTRIYKANKDKIKSPSKLRVGQVLLIPED